MDVRCAKFAALRQAIPVTPPFRTYNRAILAFVKEARDRIDRVLDAEQMRDLEPDYKLEFDPPQRVHEAYWARVVDAFASRADDWTYIMDDESEKETETDKPDERSAVKTSKRSATWMQLKTTDGWSPPGGQLETSAQLTTKQVAAPVEASGTSLLAGGGP